METCDICCLNFTAHKRKVITCIHAECQKSACLTCIKNHGKVIEKGDYTCLFCRKEISNYDLRRMTKDKTFCDGMNSQRLDQYLDDQMALNPETQADAKFERDVKEYYKYCREINRQVAELQEKKSAFWRNIVQKKDIKKKDSYPFRIRCGHPDCEGFLNKAYICGLCEKKTCSKCREPIMDDGAEHVCDENLVKTVEDIKKNCKVCPNKACAVEMVKSSGCSQMTCTQCYTVFDWNTGRIIDPNKEVIHNPHYIEYMRSNNITNGGNNPRINQLINADPCIQPFDNPQFSNFIMRFVFPSLREHVDPLIRDYSFSGTFSEFFRFGNDYDYVLRNHRVDYRESEKSLRIRYINKEITEEEWKATLKHFMTKRDKNVEINKIMMQYRSVLSDIIINIASMVEDNIREGSSYDMQIKHIINLTEIYNQNLKECCLTYKIKPRQIIIRERMSRLVKIKTVGFRIA